MQNLLEIQNALRSAPDQQLMSLMQGANSSVPQWAVASEMNSRKEMRDEQTRQEGLGQPTVLQQLTGTAPAPTPQTNVAGMPQGIASGMAQSMAPKTDVNQNKGIATMASGGIIKMQEGGDPAEKTYTFTYPESMNTPPFELALSDSSEYNDVVKAIRKLGGTIVETETGRVMRSDTAKKIIQESKLPLLDSVIKDINANRVVTQSDLKAAVTPELSGLEEYEASLPISKDIQQELDVRAIARTGAGVAEIAKTLGMGIVDVLDVGAGLIANGTLGASALATDIQSAIAAGILQDVDGGIELAGNAGEMRELADKVFRNEGDYFPRLSTAVAKGVGIPTNAAANAAAAAEQTSAMDAKIMAMPSNSSVFAEGSPKEYTPAGLAALNREYGPADEIRDTPEERAEIDAINYDRRVRDKDRRTAESARFDTPYRIPVGNIDRYVSDVAALDNRTDRADPALAGVSSLPSNFPVSPPAPMLPQASARADMATNVEGADTYNEGIATAIDNVQREVPSGVVTAQTDANSEASLDDKMATAIDPMTLLPYNNPLAQTSELQTESEFNPDRLLKIAVAKAKERNAEAAERRAEKARIAELEKGAAETRSVYGDTPYTEIPDVPLTPEAKGVIGDLAQQNKKKSVSTGGISSARGSTTSSYEQKLLDILDKREKSADQDKWLGLAEMGMRLMASSNPNALAAIGESGLGAFGSYVGQQKERDAEELNILGKLADMDMAKQTLQARKDIANTAASARANKPPMNFSQLGKYYEDRYDDALAAYSDVAPDTGPNAGNVSNDEVLRRRQAVLDAHKTVTGHYKSEGLRGPTLPFAAANTMIKTGQ